MADGWFIRKLVPLEEAVKSVLPVIDFLLGKSNANYKGNNDLTQEQATMLLDDGHTS